MKKGLKLIYFVFILMIFSLSLHFSGINVYANDNLGDYAFLETEIVHFAHFGWCIGWVAYIVDMLICIYMLLVILRLREKTYRIIGLCLTSVSFVFAFTVTIIHSCMVSVLSSILAISLLALSIIIYVSNRDDIKNVKRAKNKL